MSSRSLQKGGQIDWLDMKDSTRRQILVADFYNLQYKTSFLGCPLTKTLQISQLTHALLYTVILLDSSTSIDCVKSYIPLHSV